jgi:hypothetical protein
MTHNYSDDCVMHLIRVTADVIVQTFSSSFYLCKCCIIRLISIDCRSYHAQLHSHTIIYRIIIFDQLNRADEYYYYIFCQLIYPDHLSSSCSYLFQSNKHIRLALHPIVIDQINYALLISDS